MVVVHRAGQLFVRLIFWSGGALVRLARFFAVGPVDTARFLCEVTF